MDNGSYLWAYAAARLMLFPQPKRTIEFRQHKGTLDAKQMNWSKVCVSLVKYAGTANQNDLEAFLKKYLDDDQQFMAADLIDHIGLQEEAQYYRDALEKRVREGQ
jgi:hypothetical protein